MRIIFFDTETTGNQNDDRLCQLAIKDRGVEAPILNQLYKPPRPIPIEAMAIHHITERMVADKPAFVHAPEYAQLKELFEDPNTIAVAHNASFDIGMLLREGITPARTICTYKVANALDPNDLIPNYRLQYLRYLLDLNVEGTAHDAWGDVVVLEALFERLLVKMVKQQGSDDAALQEMFRVSSLPLLFTTIRFGKYNGKRLQDVARQDPEYLRWLLGQKKQNPEAETDWIYTLEHFLNNHTATA